MSVWIKSERTTLGLPASPIVGAVFSITAPGELGMVSSEISHMNNLRYNCECIDVCVTGLHVVSICYTYFVHTAMRQTVAMYTTII